MTDSVSLEGASGKAFYRLAVQTLNRDQLRGGPDTPWKAQLGLDPSYRPAWRTLYKPPLAKRHGDLQWRILHGIVAVNSFLSVISPSVEASCPFCPQRETVFHCFTDCHRLSPLFSLLGSVLSGWGEVFTKHVFICGFRYSRQQRAKGQLINFVLGVAKMAVYVSRRRTLEEGSEVQVVTVFKNMVQSRLDLEFRFYNAAKDLEGFLGIWGCWGVLCRVEEGVLCVGSFFD